MDREVVLPISIGDNEPVTDIHYLPDWFIKHTELYTDCLSPVVIFNVAAWAYLKGNSEDWGEFVEDVAEEQLGRLEDGDVMVTLVKELIDEVYDLLDVYLRGIIPIEQRVIVDVIPVDDHSMAIRWDEGLIK